MARAVGLSAVMRVADPNRLFFVGVAAAGIGLLAWCVASWLLGDDTAWVLVVCGPLWVLAAVPLMFGWIAVCSPTGFGRFGRRFGRWWFLVAMCGTVASFLALRMSC